MWHHQRRQAPDGTIARHTTTPGLPWIVEIVPDGVIRHYPTQRLTAHEVGMWQVLPKESMEEAA